MNIKVKKLEVHAIVPEFMYDTDAGADLTATSKVETEDYIIYGTGLAFEIPKGYYMQIVPRSSVMKYDLALANSVGIIDADYRGEVKFAFRRTRKETPDQQTYDIGDRIGQAIIRKIEPTKYIEVDVLNESDRGEGGWGSTGT